ncbi:MAG: Zn-ribbon domain-containing OB-fold protein [Chloroflexi bacterium]|nr:Zn-ribbon domain-containing OB-fold protein [Chloroflexota bacterium]
MSVVPSRKNQVPVQEGLFSMPAGPGESARLLGSRCKVCGEAFFPAQAMCANCCTETTEPVVLGTRGKLFSYTNVNHAVPGGYKGKIPFGVGTVDLPEGVRVTTRLTEHDTSKLRKGMEVELVLEPLFEDEQGNELVGFAFKPVR